MSDQKLSIIEEVFGADITQYVKNKHRGGESNRQGNNFENYFAISKIAELAAKTDYPDHHTVSLAGQTMDFVDDLVIEWGDHQKRENYQLKNTAQLSWHSNGEKSLAKDFSRQQELNGVLGYKQSEIYLIVHDTALKERMDASKPDEIKGFSSVKTIGYAETLNALLFEDREFKQTMSLLCNDDNPSVDQVEATAKTLLATWTVDFASSKPVPLSAIIGRAQAYHPGTIRSWKAVSLHPAVIEILSKIKSFDYTTDRGFFHWRYAGVQSGTLPYSCESERFTKFQNLIEKNRPATFDELEAYL